MLLLAFSVEYMAFFDHFLAMADGEPKKMLGISISSSIIGIFEVFASIESRQEESPGLQDTTGQAEVPCGPQIIEQNRKPILEKVTSPQTSTLEKFGRRPPAFTKVPRFGESTTCASAQARAHTSSFSRSGVVLYSYLDRSQSINRSSENQRNTHTP